MCVVGGRIHLLQVGQEFWIVICLIFLEGNYVNCLLDMVGLKMFGYIVVYIQEVDVEYEQFAVEGKLVQDHL